ncbi:MAG: ATPase, T2SS/T4P/T4SS family [Planctomycetota bacterium]
MRTDDLRADDPDFAVRLVDRVIETAVAANASDIHFQPSESRWEIRFRIDGVLSDALELPRSETADPVARLMVLAGLPAYRAAVPQEASLPKAATTAGFRGVEMRLGTFPTRHGQRAVIRMLGQASVEGDIASIGLSSELAGDFERTLDRRSGAILWVGPAGCGKTTTLYAALRTIASKQRQARSVLTIEDPIESELDGVSQAELNPAMGLSLAEALRSAVRQDPEVLLVSEIRDVATADAVLGAALTGHLCFSSMHADDLAMALRRLVQLKLPLPMIASGLIAIGSQRLLRKRCDICNRPDDCDACHGTRYAGRFPIANMVSIEGTSVGDALIDALQNQPSQSHLRQILAEHAVPSLPRLAWQAVDQGLTDADEVYRVLGRMADDARV